MGRKGGSVKKDKLPYEIQRENHIRENYAFLKKLGGVIQIPREMRAVVEGDSCQNENNAKKVDAPQQELNDEDMDIEEQDDPNYIIEGNEEDCDDVEDGEDEHDGFHQEPDLVPVAKKRNVRGPTKMKSIFATEGAVKIFVKINRYGQPCGVKTCNFTNFIAVLVKGGDITLKKKDWRVVPNKYKIWTIVNQYFEIDPICEDWVMKSAGKKWRDFKNTLKTKYFNDNLSVEENVANGCGARIPRDEWEWLVKYWSEEKTKEIARKNKEKRENQINILHTCGSRSYAVVNDLLEQELSRPTSRGELYIVTHTKNDGKALNKQCEEKIDQIKDRINENPDLALKSIEDGDLYDEIFPREKKTKRIVGLGLLPGLRTLCLAATVETVRQMEEENAEVKAQLQETSSEYKSYKEYAEKRFERSDQQFAELKALLLSLQGSNVGAQLGAANDAQDVAAEKSPQVQSSSSENRLQLGNDNQVTVTKVQQKNQGQSAKGAAVCAPSAKQLRRTEDVQGVAAPTAGQQQSLTSRNKVQGDEVNFTRVRKLPQKHAQVIVLLIVLRRVLFIVFGGKVPMIEKRALWAWA